MKSIRNWSIRTRLLAAFVGVLIPYLALAGVGAVGFAVFWRSVREIQQEVVQEVRGAADLQIALVNLLMPANDYLITADVTERDEFERRLARAWEALGRVERMHLHQPEEIRALAEVRGRLPQIEALSREILALPDPRGSREAPGKMKAMDALGEEAAAALRRFWAAAAQEIAEKIERGATLIWRVTAAALAALIVSVAGAVGLTLVFSRWIGGPLVAIAEGSRRMGEGDLTGRVDESVGAELGVTARAFNVMAERLEASRAALTRLHEEAEARRRAAEALAAVGRELTRSLDFAAVAEQTSDNIRRLLGVFQSALYRLEPESGDLVVVAVSGNLNPSFVPHLTFPRGSGAVGLAVRDRVPVASENVLADPRITFSPELRSVVEHAEFRSVLAVPLIAKGQVVGAISVRDKAGRVFTEDEIRMAQAFADQAALAMENARLHRDLAARVRELEAALGRVKQLQGLLPICAWCKKVRRDQNYWQSVEGYVAEHADVRFSHGICPECREKLVARRDANG